MNRWYRAYEGTVSDEKLGEVALIADVSRSVVIAAWHAILESCAKVQNGGSFDTTPRRVAAVLAEPLTSIERVFAGMTEIGMIADGIVTAWSDRQFESDNSTERSRKRRERGRNGDATAMQRCSNGAEPLRNGDATAMQRCSNGDASPPETETETETDTEKKERKIADAEDARAREPERIIPEGQRLAEEIASLAGHPDPQNWPPGWCGAPLRAQGWLLKGWKPEIALAAVRGVMARQRAGPVKSIQFFEAAIAEEHSRQAQPLPQVVELSSKTVEVSHAGQNRSLSAVARSAAERANALAAGSGLRDDGGGPPYRLLSQCQGQ